MSVMIEDKPLTAEDAKNILGLLSEATIKFRDSGSATALGLSIQRIANGTDVVAPAVAESPRVEPGLEPAA